mmetsp:Transcript_27244/g.24136  ORF Transcript_27244/g.24136 Transcript_27244/m.24136 type:complete len:132 (+) Transcript_27244:1175-1570(+)
MHRYDLLKGVVTPFSYKKSLLQSINEQKNKFTVDVLNSVDYDDLYQLQSLIELAKEGNFDINKIRDYDGVTPAHLCCSHGHEEILLFLIKLDADFESIKDKWGYTPVQRAKEAGKENLIKLLEKIFSTHTT